MALAGLYSSNGDVNASSLEELNQILSDKYDETGVLSKRLSRRLTCKGPTGIGWFTPDQMLQRLNDHFSRLFEDKGVTSREHQNSYRLYSNIALVVVPQVPENIDATCELSLVDSALPLDDLGSDNTVTITASSGPKIVLPHTCYSVPNNDRCSFDGKQAHRRLGVRWMVSHSGLSSDTNNDVTLFTISATWHRSFSLIPSYYRSASPTVIDVVTGYHEHAALRHPKLIKQYLQAGLNVKQHLEHEIKPSGKVDLRLESSSKADVSGLFRPPKPRIRRSVSVAGLSARSSLRTPHIDRANSVGRYSSVGDTPSVSDVDSSDTSVPPPRRRRSRLRARAVLPQPSAPPDPSVPPSSV